MTSVRPSCEPSATPGVVNESGGHESVLEEVEGKRTRGSDLDETESRGTRRVSELLSRKENGGKRDGCNRRDRDGTVGGGKAADK